MKPTILIVEDDREIAELIEIALARAGFAAHIAASAAAAAAQLNSHCFDLLLLDIGLPDGNGFDLLKTLRQTHTLPVIMLTAQDDETDRILGLELGADDYIGKPFSPRELIARIKAVRRRSSPTTAPAADPEWQDDQSAQCIRRHGEALPLTAGEYRLLRTLISHRGRVFSREELLAAMYGSRRPSDPHTISTHIASLRAKLREAGAPAVIKTHHGLGYSFQP